MREIVFRGKCQKDGRWITGSLIIDGKDYHIAWMYPDKWAAFGTGDEEVMAETVGQYTGFMDKKGNKIYEGDIILVTKYTKIFRRKKNYLYVVKFDMDYAGYKVLNKKNRKYDIEVIGNVHDNPELVDKM